MRRDERALLEALERRGVTAGSLAELAARPPASYAHARDVLAAPLRAGGDERLVRRLARVLGRPELRDALPDVLAGLARARSRRTERALAEAVARMGVAGAEGRVLRTFPSIESGRARSVLRGALRRTGHPAAREVPATLPIRRSRARQRLAASLGAALGAAWLAAAVVAALREAWGALAIATVVFVAILLALGPYVRRELFPERAADAAHPDRDRPGPPADGTRPGTEGSHA